MANTENGKIIYQIGFNIQKEQLNSLKKSLEDIRNLTNRDLMKINTTDINQANKDLDDILRTAEQVQDALSDAFSVKLNSVNLETFNDNLKKAGTSISSIYQNFSKAGAQGQAAFRNLTTSLLSTNVQLRQSHEILDKVAETFANSARWSIASGAVNGLTRSVEQAWGYVKSLDTSLNNIQIVTGKSADEMKRFAEQANSAAKELGATTTDYTNAALIYAQQGLSDKDVEARTDITLKTANVTQQSAAEVSEQLTAVWNGYKVSADEAELYVDRLAAVAATTASDLEELSKGMSKVASAAANMGVGEDQLAAQLSTIISVTKQAPQSVGTALRTVYARISDIQAGLDDEVSLGNYSSKMAEVGINVLDATGRLRDMGEVMEEIGHKWQGMSEEQQIYLAQTMAGQRQYNNLLSLFENFDQYESALETAQNAAGTLQEQQDTYMDRTTAHLNALKASVEDVYDSLLDPDALEPLIDGLAEAASKLADLIDGLGGGGAILESLGAIAVTVFSRNIAAGIQTTIDNFERGKAQAEQFKQALQMAEEISSSGNIKKEDTQFLVQNQGKLLNMASNLPEKEYIEYQSKIKEYVESLNQLDIAEEKLETLKTIFKQVNDDLKDTAKLGDDWKEMFTDSSALEAFKQKMQGISQEFPEATKNINKLKDAYGKNIQEIVNSGDNAEDALKDLKEAFNGVFEGLKVNQPQGQGSKLFESFNDDTKTKIRDIKKDIDDLQNTTDGNTQDIYTNLTKKYQQLYVTVQNHINGLKQLNDQDPDKIVQAENERDDKRRSADKKKKGVEEAGEHAQKIVASQQIVQAVGAVGQLAAGIKQVQNLGSIWAKADVPLGQKLFQTISNLTFSFPMIISSIATLNDSFKNLSSLFGPLIAKIAAQVAEQGLLATVTEFATAAQLKFNLAVLANPVGAFIAVLTAAVVALGIFAKAQEEARKQRIADNQEILDQSKKIQQEIDARQGLYDSIEELNQKYKQHEITRSELKSGIEDLINQYGLEGQAADRLRNNYDNLTETLRELRKEQAKKAADEAEEQYQAARNIIEDTDIKLGTQQFKTTYNEDGSIETGVKQTIAIEHAQEMSDEVKKAFQEAGFQYVEGSYHSTFIMDTDTDKDSLIATHGNLEELFGKVNNLITDNTEKTEIWYKGLQDTVNIEKQVFDQASNGLQNQLSRQSESQALEKEYFEHVENVADYIAQTKELESELLNTVLQNEDYKNFSDEEKKEQAKKLTDSFISKNFSSLYHEYEEFDKIIKDLEERTGKPLSNNLQALIKGLNQEELEEFFKLDDATLKDWEVFENVLARIQANIKDVQETDISEQKSALSDYQKEFASNQYSKYQSLEDQVRSGKTISKKEYEDLTPQLSKYFTQMANGTRKMTGDAEEFYAKVNELKLQGFKNNLDSLNQRIQQMQNLSGQKVDLDYLDQNAVTFEEDKDNFEYDHKLLEDQLNFIKEMNPEMEYQVEIWQELYENHKMDLENLEKIRDAVTEISETSDLETLKKGYEEVAHQIHDAMFPTDADVDESALQQLTETLEKTAASSSELAEEVENDGRVAEDVAESILRFDDAIQDVVDHYEDWKGALSSGSLQEQSEAIGGLRDAYADLLDMNGDKLSESFLTSAENLELMKAAIDGDIDAYDQLLQLAGEDIVAHLQLSPEQYNQFQADLKNVQDSLDEMNFQNLEIGATLNADGFYQELQTLINNAHMTADQAEDYLASMGIDAEVIQQDTEAEQESEVLEYKTKVTPHQEEATDTVLTQSGDGLTEREVHQAVTGWDQDVEAIPVPGKAKKQNKAFSLKVISAHKSSGGGFKFRQASNGGGAKGQARRSASPSKGSKGGSGGGGKKGGSAEKPDTSKKDLKKPLEDQKDIYHDIDIEIKKINRDLKRTQQQQDRLYGKQLLDNLAKQTAILKAQKEVLKEKQELQKQDLINQQETLRNLGVTFDEYGNINNYLAILEAKQQSINSLIGQQNGLIEQYNASTDKSFKEQLNAEITAYEKSIKDAQQDLKNTQAKIGNYDKLRENMEDLVDEIEEITQKEIEINIKKFRYQIEIRLEMGEAERDWNEFVRDVINRNDIMKDTDFTKTFKDMNKSFMDLGSYFDVRGTVGTIKGLTDQLLQTRDQIEQIDKLGTSAIYGDNKAKAMEDLQKDLSELMSQMADISDLLEQIDEAYLDTIDNIAEEFERQADDYEFIGQLIQHDMDLLTLLYGDKNYNAMNNYYNQLQQNQLKQTDSVRKQIDFWKKEWDKALAAGDTNAAKKFEENYKKAIQNLNSLIEQSAQTILDKYTNAIEGIFDALDKKLTNGKGTSYIEQEWDLMNKNADEYLDTINSIYAIQNLQTKFQKAINQTSQLKGQKALKTVMNQQIGILKDKQKLTQYDIDRAEKLLQIEQARIALQEAQSSKTSLRLKRDSQGNYSYEYTADQDNIMDAQQNLSDAQNDLYNFDKERYQANLNEMLAAWKEFQQEYKNIVLDTSLTEEERIQSLTLLREQYGEYINNKTEENLVIRQNLMESALADIQALYDENVVNYQTMTDAQKEIIMSDLVPTWDNSIQEMTDKVAGEGGFILACEDAFQQISDTTLNYEQELDSLANTAGVDLNDIQSGVDDLITEFDGLVEVNDVLIGRMQQEMGAIEDLRSAAQQLTQDYEAVYEAAVQAVEQLQTFVQNEQAVALAAKETATEYVSARGQMGGAECNYVRQAAEALSELASQAESDADRMEAAADRIEDALARMSVPSPDIDSPNDIVDRRARAGRNRDGYVYNSDRGDFFLRDKGYAYSAGGDVVYTGHYTGLYDTGGYTGNWNSAEGRLAILHEKEIVLNKDDTKNFLNGIHILRQISQSVGMNALNRLGQLSSVFGISSQASNSNNDTIDQNVQISASFPNVNSKKQIEDAFNNLVNLAAQRAMRRK